MNLVHEHQALIGIQAFSGNQLDSLRRVMHELRHQADIIGISSVYQLKKYFEDLGHEGQRVVRFDLQNPVSVVVRISSSSDAEELNNWLGNLEVNIQANVRHKKVTVDLLIFDDLTLMTPTLTLPHPHFHLSPHLVIPSAEIWGDYKHPIINKTIFTLTKTFQKEKWGVFYTQGKSLLDF